MEQEWQLPPEFDRFRVNAALTVLSGRFDADAACDVILAFRNLPADEQWRSWITDCGKVTTFGEEVSVTQNVGGQKTELPIGSFCVFRVQTDGYYPSIWFRPFWGSGVADVTRQPPDEFRLTYDAARRIPIKFDRYEWQLGSPTFWDRLKYAIRLRTPDALWIRVTQWLLTHVEVRYFAEEYRQT